MGLKGSLRSMRDKITGASYSLVLGDRQKRIWKEIYETRKVVRSLDIKRTILATCDPAVYGTEMEYIKRHVCLNMYNYDFADEYADPPKHVECFFDKERAMHYVLYHGKRVYYPRRYREYDIFALHNSILLEQDPRSPHLYIDPSIDRYKNGIVVELGAAEASFSLDMVESAKEVYIFECGEEWIEPLNATFAPYKNVHIIRKLVSDRDEGDYCTLDTALGDKAKDITVLKGDVEGWEIAALHGAGNILRQSKHLMLLICAYHKHNDEADIRQILGDDFKVEPRPGYILPFWDEGEHYGGGLLYPFFRHGVLKCTKRE